MATTKTTGQKKMYFIGTDFDEYNDVSIIKCTEDELPDRIDEWIRDLYADPNEVEIYEAGRKGILPKRIIQFV